MVTRVCLEKTKLAKKRPGLVRVKKKLIKDLSGSRRKVKTKQAAENPRQSSSKSMHLDKISIHV